MRRSREEAIEPLNRYVAGLPAGLLARALGLGGGAYTLDAACASSLYALKLAADELRAGRADAMLTGGLSRPDPLYTQMGFAQLRPVGDGQGVPVRRAGRRPGGRRRCGDVRAQAARRRPPARRSRSTAVIAGVGLSNDVDGGLLAPSSEGQLRAMRAAYAQAGWEPSDVDLIECHATGTPVGDAVEFASLQAALGRRRRGWSAGQCVHRLGQVEHRPRPDGRRGGRAAQGAARPQARDATRRPPTSTAPGPSLGLRRAARSAS